MPYIQSHIPPVVVARPGFVPSIAAFFPSIGSSAAARGAEIPTGQNESACGGGDVRPWALAGLQLGYSAVRCPKRCRGHQTSQIRADPDWRADRNRKLQVWQGRCGGSFFCECAVGGVTDRWSASQTTLKYTGADIEE